MKHPMIPMALIAALLCANNADAQKKEKGKAAAAPTSLAPAAATSTFNINDLLGKWKIETVDVASKPFDNETTRLSTPGSAEDFVDFTKTMMTFNMGGTAQEVNYTITGPYIISKQDDAIDSQQVVTLSKTTCVLNKREISDEGITTTVTTLKK